MTDNVRTIDKDTFENDVASAERPVLVDFYASWCAPCKVVAPIVEDIASDFTNRIDTVKVNVDKDRELAKEFSIRSIPTLILFQDGKPVETIVGITTKHNLASVISRYA